MQKQILWILNGCGLEGGSITGGPVRFHEISRRWQEFGCEQKLMTTSGGETMLRGMGCSIPSSVVPASLFLKHEPCRAFRLWSYIITSFFWKFRFDSGVQSTQIVTVSDYFCDIIPALCLKKKTNAKWTAWIHHRETPPATRPGNRIVNTLTYKMQEWSLRKIARYADSAWIYDTEAGDLVRDRLLAFGMPRGRIRIMRCGINVDEIQASPEPQKKEFDAVMIGVRPNKGLYDIIPVWEKVVALRPQTTLCLMGGMSGEKETLEKIFSGNLAKHITVFKPQGGFLSAELYYSKIKTGRILFAPSHEEGWGMAVCEAMAAGLPVVGYELPVYSRIYGNAFCKVPCFDYDVFAQEIVQVLDSPQRYTEYRERGLLKSASFGWNSIAQDDFAALSFQ